MLAVSIQCEAYETQYIIRRGEPRRAIVRFWSKGGWHGNLPTLEANESLLNQVEKYAEVFANDYLSANSKNK